jgi:hypothetical protein
MEEVSIKTHLIITDIHNEYHMNWCGKIAEAKPILENGLPIFIIKGTRGRMEINTIDIKRLERAAKLLTQPKGRSAVTSDTARIYIKEENGNEMLLGILTHKNIKTFAPMYDKVGFIK